MDYFITEQDLEEIVLLSVQCSTSLHNAAHAIFDARQLSMSERERICVEQQFFWRLLKKYFTLTLKNKLDSENKNNT